MLLIHGDCLDEMKNIKEKSIDMILSDLPYGTTACNRKGHPVLCVELNRKFSSIKQASIALNVNKSAIENCLRGDVKHAGGYSWKGL